MNNGLLPLEKKVEQNLKLNPELLPNMKGDYWARYTQLLAGLREYVYPHINAGLACLSKSPGIYTDHGPDHFDEVVRYAGLLLEGQESRLNSYEQYLLLCAIRLHDAGNVEGREEHEKRASSLLETYGGSIRHDGAEMDLIAKIAEAHGGTNFSGSKDTIGDLQEQTQVGPIECHPRQIAAVLRFADEICEHRSRSAGHLLRSGTLPEENKLFHYYADSIHGAMPDRSNKSFKLQIAVNADYLTETYPLPAIGDNQQNRKYLIDDILDRLVKLNRERMYCNQFLEPMLQTDQIEIRLRITKTKQVAGAATRGDVASFSLKVPSLSGYPDDPATWRSQEKELSGEKLALRAKDGWK